MLRRQLLEDVDSHERWLVSYADFITLLFAFFVVMYAISSVNEGKYRILSNTLMETFHHEANSLDPIQIGDPTQSASPHVVDIPDATGFRDEDPGDTHVEPSSEEISDALAGIEPGAVQIAQNNDWLEISLDASVLFPSGTARLSDAARNLLARTTEFLLGFDNPVTVEGYSDNVPTTSVLYPSNWELSSARASVVAGFFEASGVDRERLSAVGYGENHPLATNATPEGREENRRVVVVVARQGNRPRNLNADNNSAAFAFVRRADPSVLDPDVQKRRTQTGGILFTNEPPELSDIP